MPGSMPATGDVYSFRTKPDTEFGDPRTHRYAAIKILGINTDAIAIAVLDGIFQSPPTLEQLQDCGILVQNRFQWHGQPAVYRSNADWWDPKELDELTLVGALPLTVKEKEWASRCLENSFGISITTLSFANVAAEGEWRWANDREACVQEHKQDQDKREAKRLAEGVRYRTRLRGLTWEQLLRETPFERWSESPPFPSEAFTAAARHVIHEACRTLQDLGPRAGKKAVRKVLKECVESFNRLDAEAGHPIETEEREDICQVLEELAFVAKQKSLVDEFENWRTW